MRTYKGLSVFIGIALILQACGNADVVPTNPPTVTVTLPVVTAPPVVELTSTAAPGGEFFSSIPFRSRFSCTLAGTLFHRPNQSICPA